MLELIVAAPVLVLFVLAVMVPVQIAVVVVNCTSLSERAKLRVTVEVLGHCKIASHGCRVSCSSDEMGC